MISAPAEKPHLTNTTLWIMTVATGLIVANLYYNQPLLNDMATTFRVSNGKAGQIAMITQVGYAVGMLLVVPMADMFKRKRLMLLILVFTVFSLLMAAAAPSITILLIASLCVGIFSLVPQLLLPMTAHLANPAERGKKIGVVMSGLLIGILLSRTVSGAIGEQFGWRTVFYIAAAVMVIIWLLLFFFLPEVEPDYQGKYGDLMKSLITLIKEEPKLRIASIRGALCFACFSAFWTTLTFLLKQNFSLGSDAAGLFGLVGALGALAAGLMGRLSDKMDAYKLSGITLALVLVSFIVFYFSAHTIFGLIVGVIVLDVGIQATHISNQSVIFALRPEARNRINTVYMVSYFIGGALGSFAASKVWNTYQWNGVCAIGGILSVIALILHFSNRKKVQSEPASVQS
jgi:predicted MFS family arabinose efflux permease